jgi:hypothetical protein
MSIPHQAERTIVHAAGAGHIVVPKPLEQLFALLDQAAPRQQVKDEIATLGAGCLSDADVVRFLDTLLVRADLQIDADTANAGPYRLKRVQTPGEPADRDRIMGSATLLSAQLVQRLGTLLRPLFSLPVAMLATASGVVTLVWFGHSLLHLSSGSAPMSLLSLCIVFLLFIGGGIAHEVGHAASLASLDGKPGEVGIGLYWGLPVLYCNVDDVWRLKPRQRIIVNLSGLYFQSIYTIIVVWLGSLFSLSVIHVADAMFICLSILTMIGCLNPAAKFDGYWILCDLAGVPNLRQRCVLALKGFREAHVVSPDQRALLLYLGLMIGYPVILMSSCLCTLLDTLLQAIRAVRHTLQAGGVVSDALAQIALGTGLIAAWSGVTMIFCSLLLLQWWIASTPRAAMRTQSRLALVRP